MTLNDFSLWVSHTALSALLQEAMWIIPAIQTIHILSMAGILSATFLVDLRLLGLFATRRPSFAIAGRFGPWGRLSLALVVTSGSLLVAAEPQRCLTNPVFGVKLLVLVAALLSNYAVERGFRKDRMFWERGASAMRTGKIVAITSLLLWTGVVFAGRLIAYIGA